MPHKTLEGRKAWYHNHLLRERARARAQYKKHGLTAAQKARRKITQAIWAACHPEKMALYYARYYEKHKEKKAAKNHNYYESHKVERKEYSRSWEKANPERTKYNGKKNKMMNVAKQKEQKRQWELTHPEQHKASRHMAYLRRKGKIMVSEQARQVLALSKSPKCSVCGADDLDILVVHHIIPKEVGGPDTVDNKTILCINHHAEEHARLREFKGHENGASSRKHLGGFRECAVCGAAPGPANHCHHLIWKKWGGTDAKGNMFSFCGNCHVKIHKLVRRLLWYTHGWKDMLPQLPPALLTI